MTSATVAERYELLELAGRGGMGEVWRARDSESGETIALKLMVVDGARIRRRFQAEVETIRTLSHPAIVGYRDHGEDADRGPYLAMEWIDGMPLSELIAGGQLDVASTLELIARIAEGLEALHERSIVHRDLKPDNVILVEGDASRPKLLDFGVARVPGLRQSRTGQIVGTPGYIPPEQIRGEGVNAQADVFALGVILYQSLTGVSPFAAEHPVASFTKTLLEEPPALGEVRPDLDEMIGDLCHLMMAKDPAIRPGHGGEVAALFRSVSDGAAQSFASPRPAVGTDERGLVSLLVGERAGTPEDYTLEDELVWEETARITELAQRFGATVELTTGSTFAVTVPRGSAGTDAPRRAVRCALALRSALPEFRMAVATARAASGGVGETIERADALIPREGDETDSPVALDRVTSALLDGRFVVETRGEREYVVDELAGPPRPRHGARFVGRERELTLLENLFGECADELVPGVALVVGDAGTGKSRLAAELIPRLEPAPRLAWARADPLRSSVPFAVASELVALALSISARPSRDVIEGLARSAMSDVPRAGALRFLPDLFGYAGDWDDPVRRAALAEPALLAARLRDAATTVVLALASRDPLVLVIDDAHHADAPSMEWLDSLARPELGAPVFILALGLPKLHGADRFERRSPLRITLGALDPEESEILVREQLADATDADVSAILAQGGGAPFHLEELARAHRDGTATVSLLSMVEARIAALDVETRRVLRAGSILGERFELDALIALLGEATDGVGLAAALREAVEADLLVPEESAGAHRFPHGLVHQAAYAMLPDADRRLGHRRMAAHARERDADAEIIAHHYTMAGQHEEAADFLERAAYEALRGNDLSGALRLSEKAISYGGPTALRLRVGAEAKVWLGQTAEALTLGERAMEASSVGSTNWLRAASVVAAAATGGGKPERTIEIAVELLGVQAQEGKRIELVLALTRAATHLFFAGRSELAQQCIERLDEIVVRGADPGLDARVAHVRGIAATLAGDPALLIASTRRAIVAFEAIEDRRSVSVCRTNLGSALTTAGMFDDAERELRAAITLTDELELGSVAIPARITLSSALLGRGDAEGALEQAEIASLGASGSGHVRYVGAATCAWAQAALALGRADEAAQRLDAIIRELTGIPNYYAIALAVAARAAIVLGDATRALQNAEASHQVVERLGAIDEGEALVRGAYVEALIAAGRDDEARAACSNALSVMEIRVAALPEEMRGAMRASPDYQRIVSLSEALG